MFNVPACPAAAIARSCAAAGQAVVGKLTLPWNTEAGCGAADAYQEWNDVAEQSVVTLLRDAARR